MPELVELLLPILLLGAGALAYRRFPGPVIKCTQGAVGALLIMCAVLALSGLGVINGHRVLGHWLVAGTWVVGPVAIGLTAADGLRARQPSRVLHVLILVVATVAAFLSGFTGYLPGHGDDPAQAIRFLVLHEVLFPGLFAVSLVGWLFASRRYVQQAA